MTYTVRREDFPQVKEDWLRLLPASVANTVFATPQWHKVWWSEFSQSKELSLLSVREDSFLVAVAPLKKEDDCISFISGKDVSDYLDFVIAKGKEGPAYEALFGYLEQERWRCMDLHSVPSNSLTLRQLPKLAEDRGYQVATEVEDVCPQISLPDTWDHYLGSLSKKDRHELRRKMRRLFAAGEVSYYSVTDFANLDKDMDDFFRLHRLSREEKALFMGPQMESFFRSMAACMMQQGYLRLYFLEVDRIRTASVMCFDYGDELLLYNSGYDPSFSQLSVGLLLKAFCIKDAIEQGKRSFDFLRGNEPYKYDLGGRDLQVYRCVIQRD